MSTTHQKPASTTTMLDEPSAEGFDILTAQPARFSGLIIWLLVGLIAAGLVWAFVGRADVTVVATGSLSPDTEVRRFYAPIEGELIDIYVNEGQPVAAGDVVARLNARSAIEAATMAHEAELKLKDAERRRQNFALRKRLLERRAESLKAQIAIARKLHEKHVSEGLQKLAESQKATLEEGRGKLETASRLNETAKLELEKYLRLSKTPGGGGVSQSQIEEKRSAYVTARVNYRVARARLEELDYQLSNEHAKAQAALERSQQELTELQIDYETALQNIDDEENAMLFSLRTARLQAATTTRTRFENIDEDNYLQVLAPVSGVITEVAFTQPGDKIASNTPLGGVAPDHAKFLLKVEIREADRAFLREGLHVKTKIHAFPYQRYGVIDGTLEYISPATRPSTRGTGTEPVYSGHVRLERDHFVADGTDYPLRYGMVATAEIAVRKRRLIDLALDPLRDLAG